MTITSVDSLIAALIATPTLVGKDAATNKAAGTLHTPWYGTGPISAGAAPTGALNGAVFSGVTAGAVPNPVAVSGLTSRIARLTLTSAAGIGYLQIVDRLWGNVPVVTTTTSQAVTSPTWPARDTSASTNGAGVYLALEASATTGNAGAITNTTVSYTNSANTSGRTATLATFPATATTGTWGIFALASGDTGVRSVQSITLGTSYVSGQVNLIAYRPVTELAMPSSTVGYAGDEFSLGLPTVWDNSVLQLLYMPTGTSAGPLYGSVSYAQG